MPLAQTDYEIATTKLLEGVLAGDVDIDNRETLGPLVPIRLFQALRLIALGSTLENMVGTGARALVYQSGQRLGDILGGAAKPSAGSDLNAYIKQIQGICHTLSIGVVVPETVDLSAGHVALRVDECVSCAGISGTQAPICHFEAGMVGGIVRVFLDADVKAVETQCNAVGDRTCLVDVRATPRLA